MYVGLYADLCKRIPLYMIPDENGKLLGTIPLKDRGSGKEFRYEYRSRKQKVIYRLRIVQTKEDLRKWLETEGVHVIYDGHSRYGRGACFGSDPKPGDHWEDGTGCTVNALSKDDGLIRLGYDVVGIPVHDLYEHRYHTRPVQGEFRLDKDTCHPDVMHAKPLRVLKFDPTLDTSGISDSFRGCHEKWGYWKWDAKENCIKVKPDPKFNVQSLFYGGTHTGPFWCYRARNTQMLAETKWQLAIVLRAGWKNTSARPWELGTVTLRCKVFCHFGCSSLRHFRRILRTEKYKHWRKTGRGAARKNFAYFTNRPANSISTPVWLSKLFKCPYYSKRRSWEPTLEWARKKAKREFKKRNAGFWII
jgi:hypothetical protein